MVEAPKAAATAELPKANIRLINGGVVQSARYAGLEIILPSQVKTYWRMPGDSGLPPSFDWSASENLAEVQVLWPLPERIADPSGTIFGYHDTVIFPLLIKPKDPAKPVKLALKLDFAVCGDLCVPMTDQASLSLDASTENVSDTERVKTFLAKVPAHAELGMSDRLSLISIEPQATDALRITSNRPIKDLIVEGPTGWYFGDATQQSAMVWQVKILEKPTKAALAGLALTVTLVSDSQATETALSLDATGSIR